MLLNRQKQAAYVSIHQQKQAAYVRNRQHTLNRQKQAAYVSSSPHLQQLKAVDTSSVRPHTLVP
jgi:hypothetical protein